MSKFVVIDDIEKEASPLIRALSERDKSVLYFKGTEKELPDKPLMGIRVVFLDTKLEGMDGQPTATVVSSLMNILRKIISKKNGPYLIFAWTKHDHLLKAFEKQLDERGADVPKPYFLTNMEKVECMKDDDEIDYDIVSLKLEEKLTEEPIFNFIINWEKMVSDSGSEVTSLISSMVTDNDRDKWKKELNRILFHLAKACSGKTLDRETVKISQSAMKALNSVLIDSIEKQVWKMNIEYINLPESKKIHAKTKAIINTKIHIRELEEVDEKITLGTICLIEEYSDLKKYCDYLPENMESFQKDFFDSMPELAYLKPFVLEITPMCDYSQDKMKVNRFLLGLKVAVTQDNKLKKHAHFLYQTPLLSLDNDLCSLVFNFHYLITIKEIDLESLNPKYQLRIDILNDVQNHFSGHISRPGVMALR